MALSGLNCILISKNCETFSNKNVPAVLSCIFIIFVHLFEVIIQGNVPFPKFYRRLQTFSFAVLFEVTAAYIKHNALL